MRDTQVSRLDYVLTDEKTMTASLEIVGHIKIPDTVQSHRFYKEAEALVKLFQRKLKQGTSREPVVGTANNLQVELYGWGKNVAKHTDDSGFIYFVALNDADSIIVSKDGDKERIIDLPKGAVARMNDFMPHFTFDDKPRVCAFIGSFKEPDDAMALAELKKGVKALEKGKYYGAPRVASGFRAILPDECYVRSEQFDGVELMLIDDANRQMKFIETCGLCDMPAVKIDNHFPWFTDMNRCRKHLGKDA